MSQTELPKLLKEILNIEDPTRLPPGFRNIVLVGHGLPADFS